MGNELVVWTLVSGNSVWGSYISDASKPIKSMNWMLCQFLFQCIWMKIQSVENQAYPVLIKDWVMTLVNMWYSLPRKTIFGRILCHFWTRNYLNKNENINSSCIVSLEITNISYLPGFIGIWCGSFWNFVKIQHMLACRPPTNGLLRYEKSSKYRPGLI